MRFNLDKAMGLHETALYVRAKRSSVISSNLANSDTPGYQARDIDFKSVLRTAAGMQSSGSLTTTRAKHIQPGGYDARSAALLYRQPWQPSIDGNTVDAQIEKAKFAENAMQYQTTLSFLTGKFKGLTKALKGE
ncbi:MAG TPA: flagellar basal body rod protein FlgB [Gammaproteobacteria bacterium]|nr:flagellar basal body rod protein FlgB [Gammaproteobacteria bacterium]